MPDGAQELRTVLTWVTDIDGAESRIEKGYANLIAMHRRYNQAVSELNKKKGGGAGHGGEGGEGGGSNLAWGIHDLAEGRIRNAFGRIATAASLGAGATVAAFGAMKVAGAAMDDVQKQLDEVTSASDRLSASMSKLSKAATFTDASSGAGKIGGLREGLEEQIKGEEDQQRGLNQLGGMSKLAGLFGSTDLGTIFGLGSLNPFFNGSLSPKEMRAESEMREKLARQELAKAHGDFTGSLEMDRDIAYGKSVHSDPFEGQRAEVDKREREDINAVSGTSDNNERNLALIREKYQLERDGIDRAQKASQIEQADAFALIDIKRRGGDVDVATAKERLDMAKAIKALDGNDTTIKSHEHYLEELRAAGVYEGATRDRDVRNFAFSSDMAVAGNQGSTDERAEAAAQAEVDKAQEKLKAFRATKDVVADTAQIEALSLDLEQKQTAQALLRRQQAEAILELNTTIQTAANRVAASGGLLIGQSPQQVQHNELIAQADDALAAYNAAAQRAKDEHSSVESLKAQADAAKELAAAQMAVQVNAKEIARANAVALEHAQGETAVARLAASGAPELAELTGQRDASRMAIEQANYEGHPLIAQQLAEQEQYRERKSVHDLYLNPDGTRRNPGLVNKEMHERKLKRLRTEAFDRTLDRNDGLVDVWRGIGGDITSGVDPLTGDRLNAREIRARDQAATDALKDPSNEKDHEIFATILKTLQDRLPDQAAAPK